MRAKRDTYLGKVGAWADADVPRRDGARRLVMVKMYSSSMSGLGCKGVAEVILG